MSDLEQTRPVKTLHLQIGGVEGQTEQLGGLLDRLSAREKRAEQRELVRIAQQSPRLRAGDDDCLATWLSLFHPKQHTVTLEA